MKPSTATLKPAPGGRVGSESLAEVAPGGYTDACHPADGALVPETASSKGLKYLYSRM